MIKAVLRVYFKDGDFREIECLDIKLDNGVLVIVYKQFSDDLEDPVLEGISLSGIESFDLIRLKGEDDEEGISKEH